MMARQSGSQNPRYPFPAERATSPLPVPLEKGNAGSGNEIGASGIETGAIRAKERSANRPDIYLKT